MNVVDSCGWLEYLADGPNADFFAAALMQQGKVADLNAAIALDAAKLSLDLRLPMADSVMLATARAHAATLWTQDADLEGVEGVRYVARR